ncbi:MAG: MBL fold metallo-hydrolase [Planctomycetota bacterium]
MRLECLGTVGYHPNATRHTSCYLLPESGVLLDAGTGMFRLPPLLRTDELDILLSHAHLDHTVGLTFLLDVLYQRPLKKIRIWGQAAKLQAIREHLFHELIFPVPLSAEWCPIDDRESFPVGSAETGLMATVRWRVQQHPGGSLAFRIDWALNSPPKSLVYATDTTGDLSAEAIDWAGRPDLLMHECYFRDSAASHAKKTGHTHASRAAQLAEQISPSQLLLTHINPLEDAEDPIGISTITDQFPGRVAVAHDGLSIDF